jgi:hypothetical protein
MPRRKPYTSYLHRRAGNPVATAWRWTGPQIVIDEKHRYGSFAEDRTSGATRLGFALRDLRFWKRHRHQGVQKVLLPPLLPPVVERRRFVRRWRRQAKNVVSGPPP